MSVQGYLKIKTKIDNNEIDKGITELENKIKKLQTENMDNSDNERQIIEQLKEEDDMYGKLTQKAEGYKKELERLNAERNKIPTNSNGLPTAQYEEWGNLTENITQNHRKLGSTYSEMAEISNEATRLIGQLDKIQSKQGKNNEQISKFKQKIEQIKLKKVQDSIDSVGKSIQSSISKVGKLAMAVVGIKTAWGLVRSAMNTVAQYNPQIAADIEYIKYALANTLLPIIQKLISYAYTLLNYINAIVNAWFGINLFANSSASAFQKMKSGAKGTAKAAKEIKKSLQGFDEMNILQDSSSGGTSSVAPSMSLGEMQGEVPSWLKWIIDNKDLILSVLGGIGAALLTIKLRLGGIKALGIGLIVSSIIYVLQELKKYLNESNLTNLGGIIQGIGGAVAGLGITFSSTVAGALGAGLLFYGTIIKYWEGIKEGMQSTIDYIRNNWGPIGEFISGVMQGVLDFLDMGIQFIKESFDGFIMFIQGVFSGDWDKAWQGIQKAFETVWDSIVGILEIFGGFVDEVVIKPILALFNWLWNGISEGFNSSWNFIKSIFSKIGEFFSKIIGNIVEMFKNIGTRVGTAVSGAFKSVVNAVLSTMEKVLNAPIRAINGLTDVINMIPGINLGHLNTFSLPRLAKGGIIAQPTTAIIGEAGKEAVLPLENNLEYLDILADKIASKLGGTGGSYIIQMDGRTIQRGIAKKRQELAFATNGR